MELEEAVVTVLRAQDAEAHNDGEPVTNSPSWTLERCEKIVVGKSSIDISITEDGGKAARLITVPWTPVPHYRKREIVVPVEGSRSRQIRPIRAEARARLLEGIAKARGWVDEIVSGRVAGTDAIARREGQSERSVRMTLNLAFLSPELVNASYNAHLPHGIGLSHMLALPLEWRDQLRSFRSWSVASPGSALQGPRAAFEP